MSDLPSVLFMSCSDTHPVDIIKTLIHPSDLPDKVNVEEGVSGYRWHIENKYYSANINLSFMEKPIGISENFANYVQGIVLHFDSAKKNALETVESCLKIIDNCNPEIKILVTKNILNDDPKNVGCSRKSVLEWCVGKGFELVELECIVDEDNIDIENDFPESTGILRIIQALHAHVWPNLIMKSNNSKSKVLNEKEEFVCNFKNLREKLELDESLEEMVDQEDDFSQLFSQLSVLKERMSSLSGNERKDAAELIVKAFWKSLGGDDDDDDDELQ